MYFCFFKKTDFETPKALIRRRCQTQKKTAVSLRGNNGLSFFGFIIRGKTTIS